MQTIKTAIVVVLLLVVLYGAYDVLTRPEPTPPPEVAALLEDADSIDVPDISVESPVVVTPDDGPATSPATSLAADSSPGTALPPQPAVAAPVGPAAPPSAGSASAPTAAADMRLKQNPFYHEKPAAVPNETAPPGDAPGASAAAATHEEHGDHAHGPEPSAAADGAASPPSPTAPDRASGFAPPTAVPPSPALPDARAGDAATDGGDATASPSAAPTAGERAYQRVKLAAEADIQAGKYVDALRRLSVFYRSPDLSAEAQRTLLDLLDPLAARVIYSRESHLDDPYETRRHDTLFEIAKQFHVPWQLLQKINGVADPQVLVPGTRLKIVPGPFRAEVYLAEGELTLFLGDLYAGRFPVSVGTNPSPQPRVYHVKDKQRARTYYGSDGRTIPAGSPLNPYGAVWIDLGSEVSIHGSPAQPSKQLAGCIGLSPKDADDVYSILSIGSEVKIRP